MRIFNTTGCFWRISFLLDASISQIWMDFRKTLKYSLHPYIFRNLKDCSRKILCNSHFLSVGRIPISDPTQMKREGRCHRFQHVIVFCLQLKSQFQYP